MLRANGHTIVNLTDLYHHADLWQLFNQAEQFCRFAEIHCIPLALMLDAKNSAVCLNKTFWLRLLREKDLLEEVDLTSESCAQWIESHWIAQYERNAQQKQFKQAVGDEPERWDQPWQTLVDQAIARFQAEHTSSRENKWEVEELRKILQKPVRADETLRKTIRKELRQEKVIDKLKIILEEMEKNNLKEASIAFGLLAISMLTEHDPQKGLIPVRKVELNQKPISLEALETIGLNAIRKKTEYLTCKSEPYRWAIYELDKLASSDIIQTVRIEAIKSCDGYQKSHIQLYSERSGSLVWETWLAPGEYRYCNVASGKVICFLPTMAICENSCVYRPNYYSSDLIIRQRDGGESNRLNYGDKLTCFDVCADGELYLSNGEVLTHRYQLSQKFQVIYEVLASVCVENFVELRLTHNGFLLLNNRGKIRSNLSDWNGRDAVSLSTADWMQRLPGKEYSKVREFSTNKERNALVFREEEHKSCTVRWSTTV